jgi:hypothetical protein
MISVPSRAHPWPLTPFRIPRIEIAPDTPDEMLEMVAMRYMDESSKVSVPHRPIRTGDELQIITSSDARVRQEIELQKLREEDKTPLPPPPSKAPKTLQQVQHQAPPRAHSREVQTPWVIAKPDLSDFARQWDRVLVTLGSEDAIQEPSQRKAYLAAIGIRLGSQLLSVRLGSRLTLIRLPWW